MGQAGWKEGFESGNGGIRLEKWIVKKLKCLAKLMGLDFVGNRKT